MAYFPMFIQLENQKVCVVGGGAVALRKVRKLLPFGARITVIAPRVAEELAALPDIELIKRHFCEGDLEPRPILVIAATDDPEVNAGISGLCRQRDIPVNVVDEQEHCSFLFPALVQKGKLSIGISTAGASPTAAIYFKERIQQLVPENIDELLSWLEVKRRELKETIPAQAKRAGVFRRLFDACMKEHRILEEEEVETCMDQKNIGSVALVGAGCGKADLITVRGLRLLQQCEAVVYDDLIDPELLEAAPETALRIYMGKRSGAHSASQGEINQKLIELAKSGLNVVRLKGGDPYLFGRGGEEMLALLEQGIPCQEVPGIPSAIGIAAEAGIPVTHRGASRGLHIITAHTSDTEDGLPADFDNYAKLDGTLVFLMGLKQLPRIAERLMAAGKPSDTKAAVLSGGNSQNPVQVRAPLSQIVSAAEKANAKSPAIIIIGEVAGLDLNRALPLAGVRVGITGTESIAKKQKKAFGAAGAQTEWIARSVVKECSFDLDVETVSRKPSWLVFTSANGVRIFFEQMKQKGILPQQIAETENLQFAVIGSATGKILEQYGVTEYLCPETFTSEGLAESLAKAAKQEEQIILLRSVNGSPVLSGNLREAGFAVEDIAIYELETGDSETYTLSELDYLTFSSASGVQLYFEQYGRIPEGVMPVCIGPVCAEALRKHTQTYLLAEEITVEGIVKCIITDKSDRIYP